MGLGDRGGLADGVQAWERTNVGIGEQSPNPTHFVVEGKQKNIGIL
jgi:hypothetical protein